MPDTFPKDGLEDGHQELRRFPSVDTLISGNLQVHFWIFFLLFLFFLSFIRFLLNKLL